MAAVAAFFAVAASVPATAAADPYQVYLAGQSLCAAGTFSNDFTPPTGGDNYRGSCSGAVGAADAYLYSPVYSQTSSESREIFTIASPSPALTITAAQTANTDSQFANGYDGGSFWGGGSTGDGGDPWTYITQPEQVPGAAWWGIQLVCGDTNYCAPAGAAGPSYVSLGSVTLTVNDSQAPVLTGTGLWSQTGWVWNTAGDPFPISLTASDPSGICNVSMIVDRNSGDASNDLQVPNTGAFQQCPSPLVDSVPLDTTSYVSSGSSGVISLSATAANAAGTQTGLAGPNVQVDNVTPTISIAETNDNNPTGHGDNDPAQLTITPTTGPSGISSVNCTIDGGETALGSPDAGGDYHLNVDDSISQTVVCTVANNAVNPQGQHNTATATFVVPGYDSSDVNFEQVTNPLIRKVIKKRVRVDYHYVTRKLKDGRKIRKKVGGHVVIHKTVEYVERCTTKKVTVHGKKKRKKVCIAPSTSFVNSMLVPHNATITAYGDLEAPGTGGTGAARPLVDQPVTVTDTPANGGTPIPIATVTTDAHGDWSVAIPPGPSGTVTASYAGDSTQLPSVANATLTVPAKITLQVSSRRVRWKGVLDISGSLVGGYVPADGVAMRLLFKIPGRKEPYTPVAFRTTAQGTFDVKWSWGGGSGHATYPVSVAMTASESDYPFKAATSQAIPVEFGVAPPKRR